MRHSRRIEATLRVFHLDRPEDTWDQLVVPLKELAEATLWQMIELESRDAQQQEYDELLEDLKNIAATHPVTSSQVKAIHVSARILKAAQVRLHKGDPKPLSDIVDELTVEAEKKASAAVPAAPIEVPTKKSEVVTFSTLAALYMSEQGEHLQPSSVRDMNSAIKTLTAALTNDEGVELNLKEHTRDDMVKLKAALIPGRKPLTVNKLLTRLTTVLSWAINSGYLEKTYEKGLKFSKGAESGRKAFSEAQVKTLMDTMNQMPETAWKRWAMSLGAITGARIGEVFQLTSADVRKVSDTWVIDINESEGKNLKNSYSNRLVPLIDGAYGFDLEAFLRYVATCEGKLFDRTSHNFTRVLNETLRDVLGVESGEGLTYHSLRHSMASLMKQHGVAVGIAQDILGHSSQTITFDLYGGDQRLSIGRLEAALRESFGLSEAR